MVDGAYALAGAFTGFVVGLTGVGGGALMMPILLLLGVAPTTAIATDLWFAVLTKAVTASIHNGSAQIDWIVVKRLWFGSLPMALLVVALVSFGAQVQKVDWLTEAIGVVVLVTALEMLLAPALRLRARAASRQSKPIQGVAASTNGICRLGPGPLCSPHLGRRWEV